MFHLFLVVAQGYKNFGTSLMEEEWVDRAAQMLDKAEKAGVWITSALLTSFVLILSLMMPIQ